MGYNFNQGDRPLPGYTIQRGVGRGGFGEVYYATSDGGKEVALKYLRENPQVELRGVMHCLNLKSPYLVAIHDVKQSEVGDYWVVMEYVSGPSLRELMNNEASGLGAQKAAYFLREIGKGLAYLHDRGIVHRDLKPGNIFYEDGFVKIGDYGLAKIMSASQHSGQTMSVGTVHYMAPEIGSGNYDRTIDIYALGVMLYEMLLGKVPYAGATMGEVLMKHLTAQPAVDELPAPFPNVIRKALAKDPKDRYQTVNEMMAEVFAVSDVSRSVESIDSLSLTRMAASVAKKVRVDETVAVGHRLGSGSSNVPKFPSTPPPIPASDERGAGVAVQPGGRWEDVRQPGSGSSSAVGAFPQRYRVPTGLLGLFLGPLGIHRFYTGYNTIGVFQIIVSFCTGGLGGLWGIIEGVQILMNGNFRDALGRPLLESERKSQPGARNIFARLVWGLGCFAMTGGAIATFCAGTFVEPEMDRISFDVAGEQFYWNQMHGLYFLSSAFLAAALFALWKSVHRGGLHPWQATIRPGVMCLMIAFTGAAMTVTLNLAAGVLQLVFMGMAAGTALIFTFLWILRGPQMQLQPGDAYWHSALRKIFVVIFILTFFTTVKSFSRLKSEGTFLVAQGPKFKTITLGESRLSRRREMGLKIAEKLTSNLDTSVTVDGLSEEASDPGATVEKIRKAVREAGVDAIPEPPELGPDMPRDTNREYRVAALQYDLGPLGTAASFLLAIGSLSEAKYRKRAARKAQELHGQLE